MLVKTMPMHRSADIVDKRSSDALSGMHESVFGCPYFGVASRPMSPRPSALILMAVGASKRRRMDCDLQYAFGFARSTFKYGALDNNATESEPIAVALCLKADAMNRNIDRAGDGDCSTVALTDGPLLLRCLFGFDGDVG